MRSVRGALATLERRGIVEPLPRRTRRSRKAPQALDPKARSPTYSTRGASRHTADRPPSVEVSAAASLGIGRGRRREAALVAGGTETRRQPIVTGRRVSSLEDRSQELAPGEGHLLRGTRPVDADGHVLVWLVDEERNRPLAYRRRRQWTQRCDNRLTGAPACHANRDETHARCGQFAAETVIAVTNDEECGQGQTHNECADAPTKSEFVAVNRPGFRGGFDVPRVPWGQFA